MNRQGEKGISWTDWSSNPLYVTYTDPATGETKRGWHCVRVSNGVDPSGCDFCYSASLNMGRFGTGLDYTAENDGKVIWHLNEDELRVWTRKRAARIFPCDMTDLFHPRIPRHMVVAVFAGFILARHMTFQVLTKRVPGMRSVMNSTAFQTDAIHQAVRYAEAWGVPFPYGEGERVFPLENVWAGCSVATQKDADIRLDQLRRVRAALIWISLEPQVERVDFRSHFGRWEVLSTTSPSGKLLFRCRACGRESVTPDKTCNVLAGDRGCEWYKHPFAWVVAGGESGSDREYKEEWAREVRDLCRATGAAFFLKQLGAVWAKRNGTFGIDSHGKKPHLWPEDLRVQEFPDGAEALSPRKELVVA